MKMKLLPLTQNDSQSWLRTWSSFLIVFMLLMNTSSLIAQTTSPCPTPISFTVTAEDASAPTVNDAKMRISGAIGNSYRVGYSTGGTYTGPSYSSAAVYSSLTNGYISTTLPTPTNTTGQVYTIRVYRNIDSCYTDKTFTLPYVNFNTAPVYPDITVAVTKNAIAGQGVYHPLNSNAIVTIAVKNEGTGAASGVKFGVTIPAGLTAVSVQGGAPSQGTYNAATGVWDIGNVAVNQTVTLILSGTVSTRGVKYLNANQTALALTETDIDSSPTTNNIGEDDQGTVCLSTPVDICDGDEYTITLPSYTGIVWKKDGQTITGSVANVYRLNPDNSLSILAAGSGEYTYSMTVGPNSCASGNCCPLKVEPGIKPTLTAPAPQTICFNGTFGAVASTNSQPNTGDNGNWVYQWYNDNGAANPTTGSISGQASLTFTALPTAVGVYKYKMVAYAQNHPNCKDSVTVTLTINDLPVPTIASNSPVCTDNTISFTAGGGTSYAWTGPSSFTATGASPTRPNAVAAFAGTYAVTVTNGLGCSATISTPVVVNPLPIPTIASNSPVCLNNTISLTAGGGTTYAWSGPSTFTATGATPTRPSAALAHGGTYSVTVTDVNGCTATTSIPVVVNPLPVPTIASNSPVCENSTISFTAGGGTTYAWTGPATFTAAGATPTRPNAIEAHEGAYGVLVTDANGCTATTSVNVIINQNPIPTIASNSPVCEQATISFTAGGGTSYAWTGPSSFTATGASPARTSAIEAYEGTYFVTVTNGDNCSATISTPVIVNPKPVVPVVAQKTFCAEDLAVTLSTNATALGGNFLLWYGNLSTGGTGNTTAPVYDPVTAGTTLFYVSQKDNVTGCESDRSALIVKVNIKPDVPGVTPVSVCQNSTPVSLTANAGATGFTLLWYGTSSTGGTTTQTGNPGPLPSTTAVGTTTYYVSKKDDGTGCESNRAALPHVVRPTPVPTIASNSPVCEEATISLTAGGGTLYSWTGPSGFTSTTDMPTRANAIEGYEGTYVVTVTNGANCSATATTAVIVNPKPIVPVVAQKTFCEQDLAATLATNATALGGNFLLWYGNSSTGGTGSTTAPVYDPVSAGTTLFYVSQKDNVTGCESNRSTVIVKVNPKPAPPVANDATYCQGVAATGLTANAGSTGFTLLWYGTSSTGGTTTHTGNPGPVPSTAAVGTTTYYVSKKDDVTGCESNRDDAIVIVNRTPGAPTPTPVTACQDATPVSLSATGEAGNTIVWYNNGVSTTTAPMSVTTLSGMYFVNVSQTIPGTGCESPMTSVAVTINPKPVATVIPVSSLCIGAVSQNNAKLILTRYRNNDEVSYNLGTTYGANTVTDVKPIPAGGVFASSLPNPTAAQDQYTVRVKNEFGCTIDRVATITKKDCGCPGGYCEPATITKTK